MATLMTASRMTLSTTAWLTASATPLGPPEAVSPLCAATMVATKPKMRALNSARKRSVGWLKLTKESR